MANQNFKNIRHFSKYYQEVRGTNQKEWLISPDNKLCLYKITQVRSDNTSTNAHYSEYIYYKLARLLNIECAKVELAKMNKQKGIISYYFLKDNEELIDFNALIQNIREDFIPKSLKCKKTKEYYSLPLILEAVKSVVYDRKEYKKIRKKIIELIIMDSLCDHYDRNPSNLSLIRNYGKPLKEQFRLSPIYDNGTSLCMSLPIEVAKDYLESDNGIQTLNDLIISKISLGDSRFTSYEILLSYIFENYHEDCIDIINRINKNITEDNLITLLFNDNLKDLDKYHKKLVLIKVLFNKNKIITLFNKFELKYNEKKLIK